MKINIDPIHDIAVTNISVSSNILVVGDILYVNVTVRNEGDGQLTDEAFPLNVTAYLDDASLGTQNVTENLAQGAYYNVTFSWNTLNEEPGAYVLKANVQTKQREFNTANNELIGGTVTLKGTSILLISVYPEDITLDESVTINGTIRPTRQNVDVTIYYRLSGETDWNPLATEKTDTTSWYTHTWIPQTNGTYELKASWAGDDITLKAESQIVTVVVKEKSSQPLDLTLYAVILISASIIIGISVFYLLKMRKKT